MVRSVKAVRHLRRQSHVVYDAFVLEDKRVVVIGSGPPGAVAALFLCRAGANVLLLDAGSERAALGLTVRIQGFTVLKVRRPLRRREDVRATSDPKATLFEELAPGGLTNHWSCAVPRFSPEDFADAERAGEPYAWPIGYEDIAPWYDKVEPLLRIAGTANNHAQLPAGNVRRARELGADWGAVADEARRCDRTIAPMPYAYGAETTLTLSGTVFNSFVRLIRPELRSGRLTARHDAPVLRLEWSPQERRVTAVTFRDLRTGKEIRAACSAVVLAASAIGTAKILLASLSADFPEGLGNTHGVLGHYLHDHPLGKLVVDLGTPISIHPPSYLTRPTLDRAPPLYAAACMQWSGTGTLAQSVFRGRPGKLPSIGFSVFGTMAPSTDNWVALDRARPGADGQPGLQLHISYPPAARQALDQARDDLEQVLSRAGFKPRVRIWLVEPVGDSKHFGGTCRMHRSPRFGMLDAWNRLHAVPNVAVVDSSAFTTGPEKNPVLTAMALAARASHRLVEDLKVGNL
jgi:choline dehydrogenase-like flavoprotein